MKLKVLLTVDLPDAVSHDRQKFNDELARLQWIKIDELTTVWTATFKDGITEPNVEQTVVSDLKRAKAVGGIHTVNYAFHIGVAEIRKNKL